MALYNGDFLDASDFMTTVLHDVKMENPLSSVVVRCKPRGILILGQLASPITLSATANWSSIGDTLGSVLSLTSAVTSGLGGRSIVQNWFGRAIYSNTSPLQYDIKMRWVAVNAPYHQVVLPAFALLSLVYPRVAKNEDGSDITFASELEIEAKDKDGNENVLYNVANAIKLSKIPGPTLEYGAKGEGYDPAKWGDYVDLQVGRFIRLTGGYISTVSVTFSNILDHTGMPMSAEASFTYKSFDLRFATTKAPYFQTSAEATNSSAPFAGLLADIHNLVNKATSLFSGSTFEKAKSTTDLGKPDEGSNGNQTPK